MQALVFDLGGSHACGALVNDSGIVAKQMIAVSSSSLSSLLPQLEDLAHLLFRSSGLSSGNCAGMVFGFPGAVDSRTSKVLSTIKKFDDARDFDFQKWSNRVFGCRMVLENDVRLALLGECHHGAATGLRDVVMIALGTGIGTGVLMDGKPMRGNTNQAGSLGGHLPVRLHGRRCTCGGEGCAEAEASTWALPEICQSWPGFSESLLAPAESIDFRELFHAVDQGDSVAKEVLAQCIDIWTTLAIALTHAYSPQMIVIGGGVMKRADYIIPVLSERLDREAWSPGGKVAVRTAILGSSSALHGAIPLLQEMLFQ